MTMATILCILLMFTGVVCCWDYLFIMGSFIPSISPPTGGAAHTSSLSTGQNGQLHDADWEGGGREVLILWILSFNGSY